MAKNSFDLVVVGGGPGGYVAAIRAAQLGMSVALVEREHLGGICLNWGCIPTKALLRSAEVMHLMKNAAEFGLSADNISFDAAAIVKRSRGVASKLSKGVGHLLKKNKVQVFDGEARLAGKGKLQVAKDGKDTDEISAKNIILATGARARDLPDLKADGRQDVALLAVRIKQLRNEAGAVGVVLDGSHASGDAILVALEVDQAVAALVPAPTVTTGDAPTIVAPTRLLERPQQRLLGGGAGDLGIVQDAAVAASR